jgi:hypothetical protein
MPKQEGSHKMVGFMDGKIYYKMNGEYYVKNSSAPSKEKINNDPSFKAIRENNCEFGACSSVSSAFKKAFGSVLDNFADTHLSGHLTSLFSHVIYQGKGEHGKRSIEILLNKDLFHGFGFKENVRFDTVFKAHHFLSVSKDRKEIGLSVPAFEVKKGIAKVSGGSHYRFVLCLLTFSDYTYDLAVKKYLPAEPTLNKVIVTGYSPFVEMTGKTEELLLSEKLMMGVGLTEAVGIVTCVEIEFYQEQGGRMHFLQSKSCMKIAEVF